LHIMLYTSPWLVFSKQYRIQI